MRQSCNSCGGTFADVGPDGVRYFHACPPLSDADVGAALALPVDPATWTRAQRDAFAAADRRRPNARDENIDPGKDRATRDEFGQRTAGTTDEDVMKARGAGVVPA